MKHIAITMEDELYNKVLNLKQRYTWVEFFQNIVDDHEKRDSV